MKTQIELARQGNITEQMTTVALEKEISGEIIRQRVAVGHIVIPVHHARPNQ